jgi:hypothetical protein
VPHRTHRNLILFGHASLQSNNKLHPQKQVNPLIWTALDEK